jgi:penicillin-binding protein 2
LVLSVDYDLQKKSEEILTAEMDRLKLKKGAVIVMDPNNGEIISLVSLPAYNNNLFSGGIKTEEYEKLIKDANQPLFDRAIAGEYPSGSTVKMVVAAAALQEKVISEKTSVFSSGGLRVGIWFFPDWKAGGHGWTDVRKALADSVNTFFYYIGGGYESFTGLGIDRLVKYFRLFGLGDKTGIDLPNEAMGFVPSKEWKEKVRDEKWYIGDTYHLAIGQGDLLVTPLQIARWTAFFANSGKIVSPHLVKKILDENGNSAEEIIPEVKQGIIDPYNVEVVRQGMRRAVTAGSAKRMQDLPVETAAKTGTAQWSTVKDPHAWFTAFAPYKDPEIVVTVLVEEGKEGSQVALTVAHEIVKYYFSK